MTGRLHLTMADQPRLLAWAAPRMGVAEGRMPSETVAIGVLDRATGAIEAVIALNAFYGAGASLHIASDGGRRWLSRKVLAAVFGYAFSFRGLRRLSLLVSVANVPPQVLALKLGFRIEGVARCAAQDGRDGVLFGMLAEDCRWLRDTTKDESDGQERTET